MLLSEEERDWLSLRLVPGIGPRLAAALLRRFGSAAGVLRAPTSELLEVPHLPAEIAEKIKTSLTSRDVEAEMELMERHQAKLVRMGAPEYPPALAQIAVAPRFLYVRGSLEARDANAIAIVGSRACTSYGRRIAERMAGDLARAGFTVVSGLARGIDGCAHRGALEAGGRTVAVLAGGLSRIYPPEHAELAEAITSFGALVSESAMRMEPMANLFPPRNRIISGMCRAVVVVEANEKSGALITAREAAQEGREVFAIPGPVDNAASAGTLSLLRNGAKLIRHARDLLDDLQTLAPLFAPLMDNSAVAPVLPTEPPPGLDDSQRKIWDFLSEPRNVDDIARKAELTTAAVSGVLMGLELKKVIRRLPGNVYERL